MGCWLFTPRRRRMSSSSGHVEVDAVAPDAGRLQRDGGDEPQRARAVGEGADGACAALDLAVQAFESVRRADAHPVLSRGTRSTRSRRRSRARGTRRPRGTAWRTAARKLRRFTLRGVERLGVQHGDELAGEAFLVTLRHVREHVPHQVHGAALLPDLGQDLPRRRDEPGVLVAHDEAHAGEATLDQLGEQLGPARLGLRRADVNAEQVTVVVGADAVRDERGHVLDGARPPRVDERRVEVQVRDGPDDRRAAQRLDLVLEPLWSRDSRSSASTRLSSSASVTAAMSRVDTPATYDCVMAASISGRRASVPAERCGRRAAAARAADAEVDLAGGRDDAPRVAAVAHVDALVTALVRAGTDESLQLLVEDDLDGRPHRVATPRGEVKFEVGLHRNHEVGSFGSEGSFRSLHGRVSLVLQPGGFPVLRRQRNRRLLHNYRDTTSRSARTVAHACSVGAYTHRRCPLADPLCGIGTAVTYQVMMDHWQM